MYQHVVDTTSWFLTNPNYVPQQQHTVSFAPSVSYNRQPIQQQMVQQQPMQQQPMQQQPVQQQHFFNALPAFASSQHQNFNNNTQYVAVSPQQLQQPFNTYYHPQQQQHLQQHQQQQQQQNNVYNNSMNLNNKNY